MSVSLVLLCSACWLACVAASPPPPRRYEPEDAELLFENFIQTYNKQYANKYEKQVRLEIFKVNLEHANQLNEKSDHAVFGITKFMDLTRAEFSRQHTGLRMSSDDDSRCKILYDADIPDGTAPESFDWREHNAVTPVKNQKHCGSCWAFSAMGNVESQYAIKHKQQIDLSEQQLVDCDDTSYGCGSGLMTNAFRALINMGGAEPEADYPYTAKNGKCHSDVSKVKVKITDCRAFNLTSQEKVKQLLYQNGPLTIAVTSHNFYLYHGGVMSDAVCGKGQINHGVLLVGYGTEDGKPYWLIKNSWGTEDPGDGYIKIQRGEGASSCRMMNPDMCTSIIE